MQTSKKKEINIIFVVLLLVFSLFLAIPLVQLLTKSFVHEGALGFENYQEVLTKEGFLAALGNSFLVAAVSAVVTTGLAFILAYTVHYTNVGRRYKKLIEMAAVMPMLLPTITYGFAIIYSFGKQGLLTRILGRQLFEIYGFNGLLLGYVIYTLPVSFMLLNNTMGYIDKRFMIVSRIMNDSPFRTFMVTVFRLMMGTFAASFIQTFFLCFTDFGIPASVGGEFQVVAGVLYSEMLGIDEMHQGPIITTFYYPENAAFSFKEMYNYIKKGGYAIYPGKVTWAETFRIGNIGEIYREDIEKLCGLMKKFLEGKEDAA